MLAPTYNLPLLWRLHENYKFKAPVSYPVIPCLEKTDPKWYELVSDSKILSKMLKKQIHKYIKLHKLMEWNYLMNTEVILIFEY